MRDYAINLDKKDCFLIFFIACIGFIFRIAYMADYANTEVFPIFKLSDGYAYDVWARNIASGDIWGRAAFMKWPLYAYLLGFWIKLFGNNIPLFYIFQFFSGIINSILVYFIGKAIFNRPVAFIASMLYVFYGLFIFFEGLLIYTSISLLLNSVLFLYLLYLQNNIKITNIFLGGLLLGLSTVTQANIMIFGIPAAIWILYNNGFKREKIIKGFLAFIAGFLIIVGAVTIRNYLVEKDFVVIAGNTGINFYLGNNPETNGAYSTNIFSSRQEAMFVESKAIAKIALGKKDIKTSEVSKFWFKKGLDFIKGNPGAYARLLGNRLIFLFSPREIVHDHEYRFIFDKIKIFKFMLLDLRFALPFALLGIILAIRIFRKAALLYLILASFSLCIMIFFVASRYRIVMVPFLFIFAGYAIFCIWEAAKNRKLSRLSSYCAIIVAFFALFNTHIFTKSKVVYTQKINEDCSAHFAKAAAYEEMGKYALALGELNIASGIAPGNPRIIFSYGSIFARLGDFKSAEDKFKEAIRISPYYIDAYYNLGFIYNRQKRFDEARDVLEKGIFLDPDDASLLFELARSYGALGKPEEARKELESALRIIDRWRIADIAVIKTELAALR